MSLWVGTNEVNLEILSLLILLESVKNINTNRTIL